MYFCEIQLQIYITFCLHANILTTIFNTMTTFNDKSLILNRIKLANNFNSDTELASFLGITKPTLSNWHRRNSIDFDIVFSKCEHINLDWLITGKGEMLVNNETSISNNVQENQPVQGKCLQCATKDILIESKDKYITVQEKLIASLEKRIASLEILCDFPEVCAKKDKMAG